MKSRFAASACAAAFATSMNASTGEAAKKGRRLNISRWAPPTSPLQEGCRKVKIFGASVASSHSP